MIINFIKTSILAALLLIFLGKFSFADNTISTSEAVDQIQKTLLFSNKEEAEKKSLERKSAITIERSDSKVSNPTVNIFINDTKKDQALEQKQRLAYDAASSGQYEVAVELYKQILKSDPTNNYAKFALASCYQFLGQYKQAKTIYYQLLKNENYDQKTRSELIGNLISVIVEESPNDAVYMLAKLSSQNPESAYILAGAAMAYYKINKPNEAILLLKRAINIDPQNMNYQFNLAIIYDKIGDYNNALSYYQNIINNYIEGDDLNNSVPITQVKQRIEFLKNQV